MKHIILVAMLFVASCADSRITENIRPRSGEPTGTQKPKATVKGLVVKEICSGPGPCTYLRAPGLVIKAQYLRDGASDPEDHLPRANREAEFSLELEAEGVLYFVDAWDPSDPETIYEIEKSSVQLLPSDNGNYEIEVTIVVRVSGVV